MDNHLPSLAIFAFIPSIEEVHLAGMSSLDRSLEIRRYQTSSSKHPQVIKPDCATHANFLAQSWVASNDNSFKGYRKMSCASKVEVPQG